MWVTPNSQFIFLCWGVVKQPFNHVGGFDLNTFIFRNNFTLKSMFLVELIQFHILIVIYSLGFHCGYFDREGFFVVVFFRWQCACEPALPPELGVDFPREQQDLLQRDVRKAGGDLATSRLSGRDVICQ